MRLCDVREEVGTGLREWALWMGDRPQVVGAGGDVARRPDGRRCSLQAESTREPTGNCRSGAAGEEEDASVSRLADDVLAVGSGRAGVHSIHGARFSSTRTPNFETKACRTDPWDLQTPNCTIAIKNYESIFNQKKIKTILLN